ncbi:MAG: FtsX-like permease family protein [Bdellovibrionota bacterium]
MDDSFGQFQKFKVVGVYDSGLQHYDNRIGVMSIPAAQQLFQLGAAVTGLEIGLYKPENSAKIADEMLAKYNLSIKQWQAFNRKVFAAMELERVVIGVIVWLVALVAGFNILTTLFISVIQKQKDISILKALGANNKQIIVLFIKQSIFMGLSGGVLGIFLAYIISYVLEHYQFVKIPEVYLLASLPVDYDWRVYGAVTLASLVVCAFAGLYPAIVASRVIPTEGLAGVTANE